MPVRPIEAGPARRKDSDFISLDQNHAASLPVTFDAAIDLKS